jgi:uroporphyrinogen decarboxylase
VREPELLKDMFEFRTRMILKAIEKPAKEVKLDYAHFWEDMCWNGGPHISPKHFRGLMLPYYRRITELLRAHGVRIARATSESQLPKAAVSVVFPLPAGPSTIR